MTTLVDLDENHPDGDTETVDVLDDYERETKLAVKTTVAVEHALTGEHKFLSGTTLERPAAGHAGRLYINTQNQTIERDTGTQWLVAAAAAAQGSLGIGTYNGVGGVMVIQTGFPFVARFALVWPIVGVNQSAFLRSVNMGNSISLKLSDGTLDTNGIQGMDSGTLQLGSSLTTNSAQFGFLVIA